MILRRRKADGTQVVPKGQETAMVPRILPQRVPRPQRRRGADRSRGGRESTGQRGRAVRQ